MIDLAYKDLIYLT